MDEDEVTRELSKQDLLVFPYQMSNESSSAAIRDGLASLNPIIVTPLEIFDDVSPLVDYFEGFSPDDLAKGIISWYNNYKTNPEELNKIITLRAERIKERSFSRLSPRLLSIINSLEINEC